MKGDRTMRVQDALMIGRALGRIEKTLDAWEESKHPRADNGQFSSSGDGGGSSSGKSGGSAQSKADAFAKKHNLSKEDKEDIREGLQMVRSGQWSEADFDNQLKGIAAGKKTARRQAVEKSKSERLGFSKENTPQGKLKAAVQKYNLSEEEKSDLKKGLKRVISGKWSESDFENQIRGIARSKEHN